MEVAKAHEVNTAPSAVLKGQADETQLSRACEPRRGLCTRASAFPSQVLSDPEQRKRYDQFGEEGVSLGEAANSMGGQFPFDVFQCVPSPRACSAPPSRERALSGPCCCGWLLAFF